MRSLALLLSLLFSGSLILPSLPVELPWVAPQALAATTDPVDLRPAPPVAVPVTADGQIPLILEASPPYDDVIDRVQELGGRVQHAFLHMNAISVTVPAGSVSELLAHPQVIASVRQKLMWRAVATVDLPGIGQIEDGAVRGVEINGMTATISPSQLAQSRRCTAKQQEEEELSSFLLYDAVTRASEVWEEADFGAGATVVVVDTGVYPDHPLIAGCVIGGMNLVPAEEERLIDIDRDGMADGHSFDWDAIQNHDHGTAVSGLIAGHGDLFLPSDSRLAQSIAFHGPESIEEVDSTMSRVSLLGTAPAALIYAMKVFPYDGGAAPDARVAEALDRVIEMKRTGLLATDVVNMSLGGPALWDGRDPVDRMIDAAEEEGITVVVSAGNDGPALVTSGSPANSFHALAVGGGVDPIHTRVAIEQFAPIPVGFGTNFYPHDEIQMVDFSGRGLTADGRVKPDILATALFTFTASLVDTDTPPDGLNDSIGYGFTGGTSFSAPTVSGAAALLAAYGRAIGGRSEAPYLSNVLMRRAYPIARFDQLSEVEQGKGFLRLPEAFAMLRNARGSHAPGRNPANPNMEWVRLGRHGHASGRCPELNPGETFTFMMRVPRSASRIDFSFPEFHASATQNPFLGDSLAVYIHSGKRGGSDDYVFVDPTIEPGQSFAYSFPEPGNIRLTFVGGLTNWGEVSGSFTVDVTSDPLIPDLVLNGSVAREGEWEGTIQVPPDQGALGLVMSWPHDWSEFPTYDLDLYVQGPFEAQYTEGATLRSPELVLIENPAAGEWILRVVDVGTVSGREHFRIAGKFFDQPPGDARALISAADRAGGAAASPGVAGAGLVGASRPAFTLLGTGPNPFSPLLNPSTTLRFELGEVGGPVGVRVYDTRGRLVRTLADEVLPAGVHSLAWDGLNGAGQAVGSGVYFYRIDTPAGTVTRKLALAR
jgi:subtilisin family serine protease